MPGRPSAGDMAKRTNHYDVAFEQFLRQLRRPYVSVNETRRALVRDASLKSMDFIVYSGRTVNLLVDVKGRRFERGRRGWDSWTQAEDADSLLQWERVFGDGFRGLLVFAYDLASWKDNAAHPLVWEIRGHHYAFYGVWADEYVQAMKVCSPGWRTVDLPAADFRRLRRPLLELL